MEETMKNSPHQKRTLYVSDLDGTLLNAQAAIPDNAIENINQLIDNDNILFTVATARTPATVVNIMSKVHCNIPFIVMAGAGWWDNNTSSYSHLKRIPRDIVQQLMPLFKQYAIHPFIYQIHDNIITVYHDDIFTQEEADFIRPRISTAFKELTTDRTATTSADQPIVLIYSMGLYSILQKLADKVQQLGVHCSAFCYQDIYNPTMGIFEIYSEGTSKAHSVLEMAESLNADRIVVFGDNKNDLPMFKIATVSVAVGNAIQEVKQQATEIIGTNEENAVIDWIKKDILNK